MRIPPLLFATLSIVSLAITSLGMTSLAQAQSEPNSQGDTQSQSLQLPELTEKPLLTIDGNIRVTNTEKNTLVLDLPMLQAFPAIAFETNTPWSDEKQHFEGVLLADVMAYALASAKLDKAGLEKALTNRNGGITVTALDDYYAVIPWEDLLKYDVIIAYKHNGETISRRDLGPLRIIYPYSQQPETDQLKYHARSVWQLLNLTVE
ncbi:molybdopterin-dependent oxidoreductase [Ostreibacterium oceani]|uniref:Molybdopterin-dependent oxidoreductase n=1 Tax=Ostreibacterium oceani TaxID=2654998 RepID=A0A6N7EV15_9GAMM|nr:molybdopterin-dependent oxidoreductase [Ostreibacterium oceani]MPV86401.1 molybdopterin-dependent oxidoreductase [Ostreibacterium oceani]